MHLTKRKLMLLAGAMGLALLSGAPAQAADKQLTILVTMPDMAFPFFVHMVEEIKAEATKTREHRHHHRRWATQFAQADGRHRGGDHQGRRRDVPRPQRGGRLAPAVQEAVDAKIPVVTVDRRVDKVPGILAHVGADNVKGGEAQGELIEKLFPNGATVMNLQGQSGSSPAIDRNKGLHNVLDKEAEQIQVRVPGHRRLRSLEGLVDERIGARRHEESARRHRLRQ